MGSKEQWGKAVAGARANSTGKGALIMKTVSLLLASSRRVTSNQQKPLNDNQVAQGGGGAATVVGPNINLVELRKARRKAKQRKMDEAAGKLNPKLLEIYKKKTHFSKIELEALCRIYRKLVSNCQVSSKALAAKSGGLVITKPHAMIEGIDRNVFRELLHNTFDIVTEEALMEKIFFAWEKGYEGLPLRLEGWLMGLSVFLRGTPAEKAAFCFRVYDLNNDGFVTKDEMFTLLKNCLIRQPQDEDPDEGVRDLVDIALKKIDVDKDGKVSFEDYSTAVTEEPLLLEAFGQCLPTESATISFLSTLQA